MDPEVPGGHAIDAAGVALIDVRIDAGATPAPRDQNGFSDFSGVYCR